MKKYILLLSCILLGLFSLLSKYEDRASLRSLDFAVTTKVQSKIDTSSHLRFTDFIGNLMTGATFFASPEFIVVVTLIMTGLLLYDRKKKRWNGKAIIVPLMLTTIVIIEIFGKSIVHHPSPPFSMIKNPTTVFAKDYINEQFSYPSGHAARAVFVSMILYTALVKLYMVNAKKRLHVVTIMGLLLYVSLVAISRIYLGHHWFSDVFAGILIGASCGLVVMFFLHDFDHTHSLRD